MAKERKQERSASERLAEQRAALAKAQADRDAAEAAFDEAGVIAARQRVEVLAGFVRRLEGEAAAEGAGFDRSEAERLVGALADEYRANLLDLDKDVETARQVIREACRRVAPTYQRYSAALRARRALDLLMLRWPDLRNGTRLPPPPPPPNIAIEVFQHEVEAPARLRPLAVARTASMTPEQVTRAGFTALAKYLSRYSKELSPEVRRLFERAGVPAAESPDQKANREAQEAQARESAQGFGREVGAMVAESARRGGPLFGG